MLHDSVEMISPGKLISMSGDTLPDIGYLGEMFTLTSGTEIELYIYGKNGWVKISGAAVSNQSFTKEITVKNSSLTEVFDFVIKDVSIIKAAVMFRNDGSFPANVVFNSASLGKIQENTISVGETLVLKIDSVFDVKLLCKADNMYVKIAIN